MNYNQTLAEISKYLSNEQPYHRIPDVRQYSHFVKGVYIVQGIPNLKFNRKFLKWIDENEMYNVSIQNVKDDPNTEVYTIVVKNEDK